MFLGTSFFLSPEAVSSSSAPVSPVSSISLSGMVLDEIYATKKLLIDFNWIIPDGWDWDTMLHAGFQGDTYAGNVAYSVDIVGKIRIKKRYKGDFNWKTIYEKPVECIEDFRIELYDYYEPSNRDVEYAYVAVARSGQDMNAVSSSVHSQFDRYFICGRDAAYPIIFNAENTITYNRESQTIVSPGRKYPYVNHNGIARYYSGTMTAVFIGMEDGCIPDAENGWNFRNKIDQFLTDGKAKILKSFEGDMWMINTAGSISRSENGHYLNVSQSFEWTECGDPNSIGDLYDHGFIDTDVDREQEVNHVLLSHSARY